MDDIQKFQEDYINLLKTSFNVKNLDNCHEVILPLFDSRNDSLAVYIEKEGSGYRISDDSYILNNLIDSGVQLTPHRKQSIELICRKLGIKLVDNELIVEAMPNDIASKTHSLAQAMLRIDDLYLTSQDRTVSFFCDDVANFFENNGIFCTRDISFIGKSGFTQTFDFMFQRTKKHPERVCTTVNTFNKQSMKNVLFTWLDIEPFRPKDSKMFIIINDDNKVDQDAWDGVSNYGVQPYLFSELSNHKKDFI